MATAAVDDPLAAFRAEAGDWIAAHFPTALKGMTDEHDAGFYLKRAAVLEAQWGNAAHHRDRFATLNGY